MTTQRLKTYSHEDTCWRLSVQPDEWAEHMHIPSHECGGLSMTHFTAAPHPMRTSRHLCLWKLGLCPQAYFYTPVLGLVIFQSGN